MDSSQSQLIYGNAPSVSWFETLPITPWRLFIAVFILCEMSFLVSTGSIIKGTGHLWVVAVTSPPSVVLMLLNSAKRVHAELVSFDGGVRPFEEMKLNRTGVALETLGASIYSLMFVLFLVPLLFPAKLFPDAALSNFWFFFQSFFGFFVLSLAVRLGWFQRKVATGIRLSLIESRTYTSFSEMFVKLITFFLMMTSIIVLAVAMAEVNILLLPLNVLIFSPLIVATLLPVFKIADRVRAAKDHELIEIARLLSEEVRRTVSEEISVNPRLLELHNYQELVLGIWEWPFSAHVKQLILFGLMPPLFWVIGAIAEIVLERTI